jgi:predicted nucleic acid-binding Zn ribbon protein
VQACGPVRNYIDGKVEVLRLDKIVADHNEANMLALAEAKAANPVRKLVSAIDLEAWLAGLSRRAEKRQQLPRADSIQEAGRIERYLRYSPGIRRGPLVAVVRNV